MGFAEVKNNPAVRGLTARLLGRVKANEVIFQIMGLQKEQTEVVTYERGEPVKISVAALAAEAVADIQR